jgi:chromosome segregation ATPase
MRCVQCDTAFDPHQFDQKFCSATCSNRHHQKVYRQRAKSSKASLQSTVIQASSELDQLKQENERLREENEKWKNSIKQQHNTIDELGIKIDNRDGIIIERNKEIERLRLEILKHERSNAKHAENIKSSKQTLTREHLERVLTSEIRRQFPSDPHIQEHIGAIRSFNASYINALVTE